MTYILTASPPLVRRARRGGLSRDVRGGVHRALLPLTRNYVQRRALLALADPLLYLRDVRLAGRTSEREHDRPGAADSDGRRSQRLAVAGLCARAVRGEWTFERRFNKSREPEQRATDHGVSRCELATPARRDVGRRRARGRCPAPARPSRRTSSRSVAAARAARRQTSDPLHTGAGATATVVVPLPRVASFAVVEGIHVTAGYKSQGYIPGEQLSGGAVCGGHRAGDSEGGDHPNPCTI